MSVDNPDVIDIVTTVGATGEVVLVITDHLRWSDENHLDVLQAKINSYLAYIESGQLAATYPNAKPGVSVRIEVACKYRPSHEGLRFLKLARGAVQAAGWGFSWDLPQRKQTERDAASDPAG
ncbi:MAG: hypothetical protein K8U57_09960 [Planctomycetes bacterium]|nr:hypothetical protein [Planctomycetota bacterium]